MSTLAELRKNGEAPVNVRPMPNPWQAGSTPATAAPVYGQPVAGAYGPSRVQGYSSLPPASNTNAGYSSGDSNYYVPPDQEAQRQQDLRMMLSPRAIFCPCCVGGCHPCSPENKEKYRGWLKMFMFWTTIAQIGLFIAELSIGGVVAPSLNPMLGPPTGTLLFLGARFGPSILPPAWEIYRFIVPIFLHVGFIHIFFNLLVQVMLGFNQERQYGTLRIAVLYLASGIVGNFFGVVIRPLTISAGASGALYGLVGLQTVNVVMNWSRMPPAAKCQGVCFLALMVLSTALLAIYPEVDIFAHIGGFIMGVLIGSYYVREDYPAPWASMGHGGRAAMIIMPLLMVMMTVGLLAIFYTVTRASLGL